MLPALLESTVSAGVADNPLDARTGLSDGEEFGVQAGHGLAYAQRSFGVLAALDD